MSASLRVPARDEVEAPVFEPAIAEGVHRARLKTWTPPKPGKYAIKNGPREGEYPLVIALVYTVGDEEIQTRKFDFQDPYNKTLIMNQNALAGREVADHEDFDFGDYVGKEVQILVKWVEKDGNDGGKVTFANIEKVSAVKKKAAPKPVESFPDDDEF